MLCIRIHATCFLLLLLHHSAALLHPTTASAIHCYYVIEQRWGCYAAAQRLRSTAAVDFCSSDANFLTDDDEKKRKYFFTREASQKLLSVQFSIGLPLLLHFIFLKFFRPQVIHFCRQLALCVCQKETDRMK